MMRMRTTAAAAAAAMAVLMLAGCVAPGPEPHSWDASYDYGTPGAVEATYSAVGYYPACGNEVLSFEGRQWFPFTPESLDGFPTDPLSAIPSPAADASSGVAAYASDLSVAAGPVGAVVAPGPGDDVGTLVIYENDLGYWESNSGTLSRWLTSHEIEYNWVC